MVAVSTIESPPCGLYRTTRALSDEVPAGLLVNVHTHAAQAMLYLPQYCSFNRWEWSKAGHPIRERGFFESLRPLPAEGHYLLTSPLSFDEGTWPTHALVQLGYDRAGQGLVFLAQRRFQRAENTLFFGERGLPVSDAQVARLTPVVVYEEPDPEAAGAEARRPSVT